MNEKKTRAEAENDLDDVATLMLEKQFGSDAAGEALEATRKDLRARGVTVITPQTLTAVLYGMSIVEALMLAVTDDSTHMDIRRTVAKAEVPMRACRKKLLQSFKPTGKIESALLLLENGARE